MTRPSLDAHGILCPFLRLESRLLVALNGIERNSCNHVDCRRCYTRHDGKGKEPRYFHSMVSAPSSPTDAAMSCPSCPSSSGRSRRRAGHRAGEAGLRERRSQALDRLAGRHPRRLRARSTSATTCLAAIPLARSCKSGKPTGSSSIDPPPTRAAPKCCTSHSTTPATGSADATTRGQNEEHSHAGRAACQCGKVPTPSPAPWSNSPSGAGSRARRGPE